MSEPATEPVQEPAAEPAAEPVEPLEPKPGAEPAEPQEPSAEPVEPTEPEEPGAEPEPQVHILSEKEIEAIYAKMASERARHFDRVSVIVGDSYEEMAPCPLCSHFGAGLIGLAELPEDAIPVMRAMLGMPDLSNLRIAADASMCPDCGGLGSTLTGSLVPGYETKDCARCGKIGWIGPSAAEVAAASTNGEAAVVTGPQVYGTEPDDPQVASLRERGFTVIPPMAPVAGQ